MSEGTFEEDKALDIVVQLLCSVDYIHKQVNLSLNLSFSFSNT